MKQIQVAITNFTQLLWFSHMLCIMTYENFVPNENLFGIVLLGENNIVQYRKMRLGTCLLIPKLAQGPVWKPSHLPPVATGEDMGIRAKPITPSLRVQGFCWL